MTLGARLVTAWLPRLAGGFLAFFLCVSIAFAETKPITVTLDRDAINRINAEFSQNRRVEGELIECKAELVKAREASTDSTLRTVSRTVGVVALVATAFFVGREMR